MIAAGIATPLLPRIGTRPVIVAGALVAAGGLYCLSHVPVDGAFVADLLPGIVVVALGVGAVFTGVTTAATEGVPADRPASPPGCSTPPCSLAARSGSPSSPRSPPARTDAVLDSGGGLPPGPHGRLPTRLPDRRRVRARRRARRLPGEQRPLSRQGQRGPHDPAAVPGPRTRHRRPLARMTTAKRSAGGGGHGAVSAVLFLCLFAGQAGAIALSPVLAQVARDLDVSTAAAGQLRTVAGLAAGVTALALGRLSARVTLRKQLLAGSLLLALGSLASAAAPGIALLAAAQVPVGAGIAILTTAGTLAAAEWVPAERRAATLSWALIGQPAAWIVGMPLLGAAGGHSWRYAWLSLPLAAALLAGAAVAGRDRTSRASTAPLSMRAALKAPDLGRWLAAELLTNSAWAGTLVYAGALLVESYHASTALTGAVLALGARRLGVRQPRLPAPRRPRPARTADPAIRASRRRDRSLRCLAPVVRGERGTLLGSRLRRRRSHPSLERVRTSRGVRDSPNRDGDARCHDAVRLLHRLARRRWCACNRRLPRLRRGDRRALPLIGTGARPLACHRRRGRSDSPGAAADCAGLGARVSSAAPRSAAQRSARHPVQQERKAIIMNQNKALWKKRDFTRLAASMRKSGMKKTGSTTVRYESRTTIDRPVADVFARLADLDGYGTWMHRTGLFRRCNPNL